MTTKERVRWLQRRRAAYDLCARLSEEAARALEGGDLRAAAALEEDRARVARVLDEDQ